MVDGLREPIFFDSPAAFRTWLEKNHSRFTELLVGFHKKATGKPTLTWSESVDQALCFGWIDGVRRSVGPDAYTMRFTPRRPTSTWSKINVAKVEQLMKQNLMRPAGIAAFERRTDDRTGVYSFESEAQALPGEYEAEFRRHTKAWAWYDKQPAGYRRTATHWVLAAKKDETRRNRLATLIADSVEGQKIKPLRRSGD